MPMINSKYESANRPNAIIPQDQHFWTNNYFPPPPNVQTHQQTTCNYHYQTYPCQLSNFKFYPNIPLADKTVDKCSLRQPLSNMILIDNSENSEYASCSSGSYSAYSNYDYASTNNWA